MPAPLAKGLIIAASVLVAAGLALYETPQIRQWVDNSRRKIAFVLHSLGDDIQPRQSRPRSNPEDDARVAEAQRRRRREEIVRRNRAEIVRRAREEGVAVDLDELAAVGREPAEDTRNGNVKRSASNKQKSFDNLVDSNGVLRDFHSQPESNTTKATAAETTEADEGLRRRGVAARGLERGAAFANPFADEQAAEVLFDRNLMDAPTEQPPAVGPAVEPTVRESRESTATLAAERPLIDTSEPENVWQETSTASFYSLPDPTAPQPVVAVPNPTAATPAAADEGVEEAHTPTGMLTPTDDGFSTSASVAGSAAADADLLSDAGFTDATFSEIGHSEAEGGRSTPGSWTDVNSEEGSDDGHGHGHVH